MFHDYDDDDQCQLLQIKCSTIKPLARTVCILAYSKHLSATQQQSFYGPLFRTTQVSRYQKKHSPTHHPDHHTIFISFLHLLRSIASSLFKMCAIFLHNLSPLPTSSTSWSGALHLIFHNFFTQSVSSFCNTCPYYRNLFCCSINIISSIPSLSLNSLLGTLSFTLTLHIHLTTLISAR